MEVIRTPQGGNKLIHGDYTYIVKKRSATSIRWACTKAKSHGCKGGLTTDNPSGNPRSIKEHNHLSSGMDVELSKFRQAMKEASESNYAGNTANIMASHLHNLSQDALAATPSTSAMKRDIQRHKAKSRPSEPQTLLDIDLQPPWTTTGGENPEMFLLHDSGIAAGDDRMLVFGTDDALVHLASTDTWFLDGNFKCAPDIFEQLYVIRAKLDEGAVSCIYAFLPGKDTRHYRELFTVVQREIRRTGAHINLETITVDFERGAYGAFKSVFGQHIDVNGCFFHLTQSTQRKAGDLGLKPYIMDNSERLDPDIRMFVAMIDAMAFVPIPDLQAALNALNNNVPDPRVLPLLDYFVCTYVH